MRTLVEFYNTTPVHKFVLVCLTWLFWPGLMFVTGFIGESRIVPIGKLQSKAFFPGDLSFGVIFVALIGLYQPNEEFNTKLCCILFVPVLYFAWLMRRNDAKAYPPRSRISPTKLVHDLIGYFIIPLVLLTLCLTKLSAILIYHKISIKDCFGNWMVALSALLFYIICVAIDEEEFITEEHILARHPDDWRPIWKRNPR